MGRINSYPETTGYSSDDYFLLDGAANGTRKIKPSSVIQDLESAVTAVQVSTSELEIGEYVLSSGVLLVGFYPLASGTIGTSARARMIVFPVKENTTYYITWQEGTNQYRTAFGDTPAEEVALDTPIYDFTDNRQTSHVRYPKINTNHQYLYIYVGSGDEAAALTAYSAKVSLRIPLLDSYMAADGDSW